MSSTQPKCGICKEPQLVTRKLTPKERAWVNELQSVLMRAPEGLSLMTIGGRELTVLDEAACKKHGIEHIYGGGATRHGVALATVSAGCGIHGCSG